MIIAFIGGIGSGKTVSVIKEIVSKKGFPLTNFRLKKCHYHRLKYDDLLRYDRDKNGKVILKGVNWEFWENLRKEHMHFSIYLDEVHNIISSRTSMSKRNIYLSQWISQIRKVLSDSANNHLYIITQTPRKLDVNFRELTHVVIACKKIELPDKKILIIKDYYDGFDGYEMGQKRLRTSFYANPYFKYYDSYEMVRFSDADEFI